MANTLANVRVEPIDVSWDGVGLGFLDGNVEPSFTQELADIVAQQRGASVLGAVMIGQNIPELTVTLKEASRDQLEKIFSGIGSSVTPSGGTEVFGMGPKKDFAQVLTHCKKLVLHPVALGASLARDIAFWLALPIPGSIVYSGEDIQTVSVTFRIFPDLTKVDEVQLFCYGDHTQDLDA